MRNFADRVEDKIEVLFTFLNKESKNKKESRLQIVLGLGLFTGMFVLIGLAGSLFA